MLKDLFKKQNKKKDFINSIADGYVDIKAYKHEKDGEKKLIYHNTGDNTITDWMRQAIMLALSGYPLSFNGNNTINANTSSINEPDQISKPNVSYHGNASGNASGNADGYCLNGEQYLWDAKKLSDYPITLSESFKEALPSKEDIEFYALFPTKILLGTGCEYTDWQTLKNENEEENETWYHNRISEYGNGEESIAEQNFNSLVGENEDSAPSNQYSATVSIQGVYSGSGKITRAVTVNDPDTTTNVSSSADMSKRYGVVGAIKTLYCPRPTEPDECAEYLKTTVDDSGRLLKGQYRGAGRPCFIYFNRTKNMKDKDKFDWDEVTSDISVQRDSSTSYLNRLTFRVVIPAQSSGTGAVGEYNPFNGYVFKQVGLFNDAFFSTTSVKNENISGNMPCGMMLAVKNIQNFTKTADESIEFTWTLTI